RGSEEAESVVPVETGIQKDPALLRSRLRGATKLSRSFSWRREPGLFRPPLAGATRNPRNRRDRRSTGKRRLALPQHLEPDPDPAVAAVHDAVGADMECAAAGREPELVVAAEAVQVDHDAVDAAAVDRDRR